VEFLTLTHPCLGRKHDLSHCFPAEAVCLLCCAKCLPTAGTGATDGLPHASSAATLAADTVVTPPPLTQPLKQPAPEPAEVESPVTAVNLSAAAVDNTMGKAKDDAVDRAKGDAKEGKDVHEAARKAMDDAKQLAHESPFPEAADEVRSCCVQAAVCAGRGL
jgi:hypothetical protein